MNRMFAFAATLAAGMALTPMAVEAANVPTITFYENWGGGISGGSSGLGGTIMLNTIEGQGTPQNSGERRICNLCLLSFGTGWKGGGDIRINGWDAVSEQYTDLLTGSFAGPVTGRIPDSHNIYLDVVGELKDVVIHEDLAADYGVPNWGAGEITTGGFAFWREYFEDGIHYEEFHVGNAYASVDFHPVPVPAALPLMLTALAGLGLIRLRRAQATA